MSVRDEDLRELDQIATRIDELQGRLQTLFDARRVIWKRRLDSKDTKKADLARASRCHSMNVTQGVKPELMKKVKKK